MADLRAIYGSMEDQERFVLNFESLPARFTNSELVEVEAAEPIGASQGETDALLQTTIPFLFKPLCEDVWSCRPWKSVHWPTVIHGQNSARIFRTLP